MAFVSNMEDEQKPDQGTVQPGAVSPSGGGGAVRLSPSSAVGTVGGGGTTGTTPSTAGGQFGSLQNYLTANQGQAEPLAGQVMAPISAQYKTLDTQNQGTLQGIKSDIAGGYTPQNADVLAQEAANPVSFASNPGNVVSFQKQLNDVYGGPASAESTPAYQAQQNAVNSAIAQGTAQTGSEAGRKELLTNVEATPTAGVTALNSAILSENPNYLGQVEKAYDPFQNLVSGLSTGAQGLNTNIAGATSEAQAANQAANDAIKNQVAGLNTAVGAETQGAQANVGQFNKDVSTLQGAASGYNKDIQDFLAANPNITSPTPADLTAWLTLQQFTGAPPTNATAATAQDYATANALQTLNGTAPAGMALNPTEANLAGTALPPNYQAILSALSNGNVNTAMTNEVQGLGNQITGAYQPIQAAQAQEAQLRAQADALSKDYQMGAAAPELKGLTPGTPEYTKAFQDLYTKSQQLLAQAGDVHAQTGRDAQGLQWLPGAATNYNALLTKLQADLAPVSNVTLPAQATAGTNNDVSNAEKGLDVGTAGLTAPTVALGNSIANNPQGAAERTALFFPTFGTSLFLPKSTLDSIGNGISSAVDSIGNFFGGLF